MPFLVVATISEPAHADGLLQLVEGAAVVLGPRGSVEVTSLGSFAREIRGKTEVVCAAIIEPKSPRPNADATVVARDFETVLRSMVAAGDLQGCDARAYAR